MKSPVNLSIDQIVTSEDVTQKLINDALRSNSFVQPVQVVDVDINNLTVNVKPLLLGETTESDKIESNTIFNVKYIRIQSGNSAIIIDPTVGDIGIVVVCDKDISTVNETKTFATPSSNRIHSLSDSVFLCGLLNKTPNQFIKFTSDGIEINSPVQIKAIAPQINAECDTLQADVVGDTTINAKRILLNGSEIIDITAPLIGLNGSWTSNPLNGSSVANINIPLTSTKDITSAQEITAKDVKLSNHVHSGVRSGSEDTGGPK